MINLLLISNPSDYSNPNLDISIFYRQIAKECRLNCFHLPTDAVLEPESTKIIVAPLEWNLSHDRFLKLNAQATELRHLQEFDLVFCRTLKPFPSGYLNQLSRWENFTQFVNNPSRKIEQIEPNFLAKVASKWTPEMLVTDQWQAALAFWEKHQIIVAKQYNSCGGRGVFKIWYEDSQFQINNIFMGTRTFAHFSQVIPYLQGNTEQPLQFVRYLNQVHQGDKRIIVVDGEIYGAFIRRSKSGHWINNISGDGECFLAEISDLEREAIEQTIIHYQSRNLRTLGYDFLMDEAENWRISEINVGNIGGFARLEQLTGQPIMQQLINWLIDFARHCQKARSTQQIC